MRTLFTFNIQSYSDIITNSSSELFVFEHDNLNQFEELLNSIYPNWRGEYKSPKRVKNLSKDELEIYLDSIYPTYNFLCREADKNKYTCPNSRWAREFKIPYEDLYSNWDEFDPNYPEPNRKDFETDQEFWKAYDKTHTFRYLDLKDNWDITIRKYLPDEIKNQICLFSIYENPDWEYQQVLSEYGSRHHLG